MDGGWQPAGPGLPLAEDPGPVVAAVLDGLVAVGWDRADAADAIAIMADHASPARSGSPTTRWRWVSLRLGVPEWQARRLAGLLLGGGGWPGVLELVVRHGTWVTGDPAVLAAVRSTTVALVRRPRCVAGGVGPAPGGDRVIGSSGHGRRGIAHAVGIRFGVQRMRPYHTIHHLARYVENAARRMVCRVRPHICRGRRHAFITAVCRPSWPVSLLHVRRGLPMLIPRGTTMTTTPSAVGATPCAG